jgi:hypothetical protein
VAATAQVCADSLPLAGDKGLYGDQGEGGRVRLDPNRPVPAKAEVIAAWRKRQESITSFQFGWSEELCHREGWIPNPRYTERERLTIPTLRFDRSYTVAKTLAVQSAMMRYSYQLDRAGEPDGVEVVAPNARIGGLGVRRYYSYLSVFDGERGRISVVSLTGSPPPVTQAVEANVDAQNLPERFR